MYLQVIRTEFKINQRVVIATCLIHLLLLIYFALPQIDTTLAEALGLDGEDTIERFTGFSSSILFFSLAWIGVTMAYEHRTRFYSQLPISNRQYYIASWLFIGLYLLLHLGFWTLQAAISGVLDGHLFHHYAQDFLTYLLLVAVISLAFDLSAFKPRIWQFLYVAMLLGFLFLDVQGLADLHAQFNPWVVLLSTLLILPVSYFVYVNSENYLG